MKKKLFLSLLEQLCMITVFTVVSVFCLQGFFGANNLSEKRRDLDNAVIASQNAAELIKQYKGNMAEAAEVLSGTATADGLTVKYDENWTAVSEDKDAAFLLKLKIKPRETPLLGEALVEVIDREGVIFSVDVAWQEDRDEIG